MSRGSARGRESVREPKERGKQSLIWPKWVCAEQDLLLQKYFRKLENV